MSGGRWGSQGWLVVVGLVLAACGGGDGTGASTTEAGGTTAVEGGSGEQVDLTVFIASEDYVPPDNFESFHETYPNINVTVEISSSDELFEKLLRMRDAGEPLPDVFQMSGINRGQFFEAGLVRPIDDMVELWEQEDPELFNQLYPAVWEQGMYDGQIVGMADSADMDQIFYRLDWWQEAGFEDLCCESWDQILEASRLIKADRPDIYPWAMQGKRGEGVNSVLGHMAASGIEFEGSIPQLTTEAGYHLINFYQTMAAEELTHPETITWGEREYRGAFAGSRAAFSIDAIHAIPGLNEAGLEPDVQWKISNMPTSRTGENKDGAVLALGRNWHIGSDTEHPYEASLVLRYIMWPENALAVVVDQGRPASRHQYVLEHPDFRAHVPLWTDEMIDDFINSASLPVSANVGEIESVLELFVQDMLQNPATPPEETAAKWQAELDALAQ